MDNLFFKDRNTIFTWTDLIADINSQKEYNPYCCSIQFYHIFKHIVSSMVFGKSLILLDSDFSNKELISLTGESNFKGYSQSIKTNFTISGKNELIEILKKTSPSWEATLFTSGTTGLPKKVVHDFNSLTRFIKCSKHHSNDVWGYAYHPTHIAGLQVFLQALLNGNSIVRLFGIPNDSVLNEIENNQITHISASPTFYKLLVSDKHFASVKRITSGGEKLDKNSMSNISAIFPNAKITNVYASTEAGTIFASKDDIFVLKGEFQNLVKIENNEILIHRSLLGKSDLDIEEWYPTGDLVEIISDKPLKFRFATRKNEIINVGAYKVNPNEVENAILEIEGIKAVKVFGKKNSIMGNIVCCEIVTANRDLTEITIRKYLQGKLQEFKIPRIIKFVDKLKQTRTGKTKKVE